MYKTINTLFIQYFRGGGPFCTARQLIARHLILHSYTQVGIFIPVAIYHISVLFDEMSEFNTGK